MRVMTLKAAVIVLALSVVAVNLDLAPARWGKPVSLARLVGVRYVLRLGLRRWQARIAAF